jgi:HEAT repeat protein
MTARGRVSRFALSGVGTALLLLLIAVLYARTEPGYGGKSLSDWLREPPSDKRTLAVGQMGTKALPWLIRWLAPRSEDRWRRGALVFLRRHTPLSWKFLEPIDRQPLALSGLYALGTNAAPAAPLVVNLVTDPSANTRRDATLVLDRMGLPGIRCLTAALRTAPENRWPYFATALGHIAVADDAATDALLQRIADSNLPNHQAVGIGALALVGRDCPKVIPALAARLSSTSEIVKDAAVVALCSLGPRAQPAVPTLLAATNLWSWSRRTLVGSLSLIENEAALPHLMPFLEDENAVVRSAAVSAIAGFAQQHPEVMPKLIQQLRDPDGSVVANCVHALKRLRDSRWANSYQMASGISAGLLALYADLKTSSPNTQRDLQFANVTAAIREIDPETAITAGIADREEYPWLGLAP